MIGRTLQQYQIEEEIGRGGMGVVYRARDLKLQRDVALKVVSPELTRDPAFRDRLVQEARAAAALTHPAISVVYGVDEADGVTFVAMELIRGAPLVERMAGERLAPARALELAMEVAEALVEGHAHGVVHRDLKPGNVMVTESGHAKIIDFGVARQVPARGGVDSDADTPARGAAPERVLAGTAAYMSPEQVRGTLPDQRGDVFSFGALLYEMLAGRPAFARRSALESLHAVLRDPTPRLPDLGAASLDLQRIVDKCLAKDAADRYQTAGDLVVDLRAVRRQLEGAVRDERPRRAGLGVVIVDDEEPAREILKQYLAQQPAIELLAECRNGFEAVKAVAELKPDVVFLDVQMPKLDGFEVVELIGPDVNVVFVTAFDEHAVRAFEVNAVDYLLKPVGAERFCAALERARQRAGAPAPTPVTELLAAARPEGSPLQRILVREGAQVEVVPVAKLDYLSAEDDYVRIHAGGRELLKQQTLAELETLLDPRSFIRIHRSYILNVDRIRKLETDDRDNRVAVLADGSRLPVSRAGYARLKQFL